MSNALIKEKCLHIPKRDKHNILKPKPSMCKGCSHEDQVANAFEYFYLENKETFEELAKI